MARAKADFGSWGFDLDLSDVALDLDLSGFDFEIDLSGFDLELGDVDLELGDVSLDLALDDGLCWCCGQVLPGRAAGERSEKVIKSHGKSVLAGQVGAGAKRRKKAK